MCEFMGAILSQTTKSGTDLVSPRISVLGPFLVWQAELAYIWFKSQESREVYQSMGIGVTDIGIFNY